MIDKTRLAEREPIDPDLGPATTAGGREAVTIVGISIGGVVGALARYEAAVRWPTRVGAFPWTTLAVNVLGCGLLATLLALTADLPGKRRPLVRAVVGTGMIGGFTTFSTFSVDLRALLAGGHVATTLVYGAVTLVAGVTATWWAMYTGRRLTRRARS